MIFGWHLVVALEGQSHLKMLLAEEAVIEYIVDAKFMDKDALQTNEVFPLMLKEDFWEKVNSNLTSPEVIELRELKNY